MNKEVIAKKKLIENELSKHLEGFEDKVRYNRKKTFTNHFLVVLLGGFVTFSNELKKLKIVFRRFWTRPVIIEYQLEIINKKAHQIII